MYIFSRSLNNQLLDQGIIPLFFVKNSESNIIISQIPQIGQSYHSDLHWASRYLNPGERTSFFQYESKGDSTDHKIFCYLKAFQASPQRIEMHGETFAKYRHELTDIFDILYYLFLVNGSLYNPQVRPVAIAERYAREAIKPLQLTEILMNTGIMATMDQIRFS